MHIAKLLFCYLVTITMVTGFLIVTHAAKYVRDCIVDYVDIMLLTDHAMPVIQPGTYMYVGLTYPESAIIAQPYHIASQPCASI